MGNRVFCNLGFALPFTIAGFMGLIGNSPVFAQLTADDTLGAERSTVIMEELRDLIRGGAIRGNALFHSFSEFNVGSDRSVFFDLQNNADILNIFTRVTGSNSSQILGTLGVLNDLGNANLFLLNPNGITFGENASLDLNGSFFATTAESFDFDNFSFSASGQETPPPLLTISIPRFLSFRDNPETITVDDTRLRIDDDQTLGFIGGKVQFINGARARVNDGRIEIGAVGGNSLVSFTETQTSAGITNYVLGYEGVETFEDILLGTKSENPSDISEGRSQIRVNGNEGGGTVQLQGRNITLINARITSNGNTPSRDPGDILINSSVLTLENESALEAQVLFEDDESTDGASITINTEELQIFTGARIQTFANLGTSGDGGDITITATDSVQISGSSPNETSAIFAQTQQGSTGNAGNITIDTPQLLIQGGGRISATTRSPGNGGDVTVNATEYVRIIGEAGEASKPKNRSFLNSQVRGDATGNGGNITIDTPQLLLQDGGRITSNIDEAAGNAGTITINATEFVQLIGKAEFINDDDIGSNFDTLGSRIASSVTFEGATGNGGQIIINAPQLLIQDGALVDASTEAIGNGGSIKVNVSDTVLIEGEGSGIFSRAIETATGNAGSINIDPQQVTVQDNGIISVSNLGTGESGILIITSDNLTLNNGSIIATTDSADGGNITFNITDLLRLSNESLISATAGEEGGEGDGGNVTINIDDGFIVAFPPTGNQGSDILASAISGDGGDINITATEIFGIAESSQGRSNDINASSNTGISGTVTLNTPDTQTNQEQIEQPEDVVDSSDIVSQSVCSDFGGDSQLNNIGRGGVPQIPGFIIRNDVVDVDLVDEVLPAPPPEAIKPHHRTDVTFLDSEGEEFKPAMGAVLLPNGMVEFVDYNPAEVYRDMYAAAGCNRLSKE